MNCQCYTLLALQATKIKKLKNKNAKCSCLKGQLKWKIDLCLNNRLVTAKQISIDSSGLSRLAELLQTIEH